MLCYFAQMSAPLLLFSIPPAGVLQGGITTFSKKMAFIRQLEYCVWEFLCNSGKVERMHLSMFGSFTDSKLASPILATHLALLYIVFFYFHSSLQFSVMLTSSSLMLLVASYLNLQDVFHHISVVAPCPY